MYFSSASLFSLNENQRKASILQQGQTNGISRGQFLSLEFLVPNNESKLVTFQPRTCAGLLEIVCARACVCKCQSRIVILLDCCAMRFWGGSVC